MPGSPSLRLDQSLVERHLAATRSRARALILAGDVLVNGQAEHRAGHPVASTDAVALRAVPRFVSRGGEKLDHALDAFAIDVANAVAADLGASTGGFTDCLLQRGAARVYAIDVGYGHLDVRLRDDARVVVMERVNARYLDGLPEPVDLAVIDVSFISLDLIFPVVARLLRDTPGEGTCVPLIKPQFEAGRGDVGRGGVVRDPAIHRRVLDAVTRSAEGHGLATLGIVASPLRGPAGNVEFLAHLRMNGDERESIPDRALMIDTALGQAAEVAARP